MRYLFCAVGALASGCTQLSKIGLTEQPHDLSAPTFRTTAVSLERTRVSESGEASREIARFLATAQKAQQIDSCIREKYQPTKQDTITCEYEIKIDGDSSIQSEFNTKRNKTIPVYTVAIPEISDMKRRPTLREVFKENQDVFRDMLDQGIKASDTLCTARLVKISANSEQSNFQESQFGVFNQFLNAGLIITASSAKATGWVNAITSSIGLSFDNYQDYNFITPDHHQLRRLISEGQAAYLASIANQLGYWDYVKKYDRYRESLVENKRTSGAQGELVTLVAAFDALKEPCKGTPSRKLKDKVVAGETITGETLRCESAVLNYSTVLNVVGKYDYQCTGPRIE